MGGGPNIPDPNTAAIAGTIADAQNFPFRYIIDAVAKQGGKWTDPQTGKVYDFTGKGDADNAAVISDKMAQALLDIQKNYGAAFVKQRLADLKRSDPNGYAARQQLFDRIIADADKNPDRPLAEDTQAQVLSLLQQGGNMGEGPGSQTEQVQQNVRGKQLRGGIYLGNAAASEEANAVEGAGEAQRTARQQQALQFQTAGISPEDVEYRRIQQALGNLGAFVNGQTPTAQFGSLSAASNGAAPFTTTGGVNQSLNPNAGQNGVNNANQMFNFESQYSNNQVSPWVSGVQGGLGAWQTYNAFQNNSNPFLKNYPGSANLGARTVNSNTYSNVA